LQQVRQFAVMTAAALSCSGCAAAIGASIAASMATSTATHIALDKALGESKVQRDARAAFERAPACASMPHGVQNGRVATVVNDVMWTDAPEPGNWRVKVDYRISNSSGGDVVVAPRRLTVTDSRGKLTNAQEGNDGLPPGMTAPDTPTTLPAGASWQLASTFEVPAGELALMVPNGRGKSDPEPTWVDGCRFPGPPATAQR